jgi:hypothetical protein
MQTEPGYEKTAFRPPEGMDLLDFFEISGYNYTIE